MVNLLNWTCSKGDKTMQDVKVFVFGLCALLMAGSYFCKTPFLIKKTFRDVPGIKKYAYLQGVLYSILGIVGILYAFQEEDFAQTNPTFALAGGLFVVAVVLCIGVSSRRFINRATRYIEQDYIK